MGETVVDRQGRRWVVRRRWMPRLGADTLWGRFRRRVRGTFDRVADGADVDPGCGELLGEGIAAALVVIAAALLLFFVVIPVLVVVDVLILLVLAGAAALARVLFRRPWTVEAAAEDGGVRRWRVVGWRASGERCAQVARRLEAGLDPDV